MGFFQFLLPFLMVVNRYNAIHIKSEYLNPNCVHESKCGSDEVFGSISVFEKNYGKCFPVLGIHE